MAMAEKVEHGTKNWNPKMHKSKICLQPVGARDVSQGVLGRQKGRALRSSDPDGRLEGGDCVGPVQYFCPLLFKISLYLWSQGAS